MVKEVHRISSETSTSPYEQNGVSVFSYVAGSVPDGSVLNAADEGGSSNPFPDLGGGFGSSIQFNEGAIAEQLEQTSDSGNVRFLAIEVEASDADAAVAEAVGELASRDDADYVVVIRERNTQ
jgi:hypothetical protein